MQWQLLQHQLMYMANMYLKPIIGLPAMTGLLACRLYARHGLTPGSMHESTWLHRMIGQ
jgi:hypothetical protein